MDNAKSSKADIMYLRSDEYLITHKQNFDNFKSRMMKDSQWLNIHTNIIQVCKSLCLLRKEKFVTSENRRKLHDVRKESIT